MKKVILIFIIVILFFTACSIRDYSIDSITDPEYIEKQYDKMFIMANIPDISYRRKIESNIAYELKTYDVETYKGIELLPPTQERTKDDYKELFEEHNIDGYLFVALELDTDEIDYYLPKTGEVNVYQDTIRYTEYSDRMLTSELPVLSLNINLFDIDNQEMAWMADIDTSGYYIADYEDLIKKASKLLSQQIYEDGLILK